MKKEKLEKLKKFIEEKSSEAARVGFVPADLVGAYIAVDRMITHPETYSETEVVFIEDNVDFKV